LDGLIEFKEKSQLNKAKAKVFYFCLTKSSKSHGTGQNWLKIIVFSLNLIPTPTPDKIFNAHPLDFLNTNFYVPEVYCFAATSGSEQFDVFRSRTRGSIRLLCEG